MHADFTIIPKDKLEEIKGRIDELRGEPTSPQTRAVELILMKLDLWTQWDDDIRRIVGEAEEEQRQASEVSDVSAASV